MSLQQDRLCIDTYFAHELLSLLSSFPVSLCLLDHLLLKAFGALKVLFLWGAECATVTSTLITFA